MFDHYVVSQIITLFLFSEVSLSNLAPAAYNKNAYPLFWSPKQQWVKKTVLFTIFPLNIQFGCTWPSTISEYTGDKNCYPHWYTQGVKEAVLKTYNFTLTKGTDEIEIWESWIPTIKIYGNRRSVWQQATNGMDPPEQCRSKCTSHSFWKLTIDSGSFCWDLYCYS